MSRILAGLVLMGLTACLLSRRIEGFRNQAMRRIIKWTRDNPKAGFFQASVNFEPLSVKAYTLQAFSHVVGGDGWRSSYGTHPFYVPARSPYTTMRKPRQRGQKMSAVASWTTFSTTSGGGTSMGESNESQSSTGGSVIVESTDSK